jgi:hypothetical protein
MKSSQQQLDAGVQMVGRACGFVGDELEGFLFRIGT